MRPFVSVCDSGMWDDVAMTTIINIRYVDRLQPAEAGTIRRWRCEHVSCSVTGTVSHTLALSWSVSWWRRQPRQWNVGQTCRQLTDMCHCGLYLRQPIRSHVLSNWLRLPRVFSTPHHFIVNLHHCTPSSLRPIISLFVLFFFISVYFCIAVYITVCITVCLAAIWRNNK